MKRRDSITRRFLLYLIGIIVLSNLVLFIFHYGITQKNMRQQSIDMSRDLMESNLTMMEQYFGDIDCIADSIIYNDIIVRFMKSSQDKASDLEFLHGIESLYYNSRPDLRLSFYKERHYNNMYSIIQENRAIAVPDYRNSQWYQQMQEQPADKLVIANNMEDQQEVEFVHSIIYRIEDVYSDATVGYLKIDMDLNSLKERFVHGYKKVAGTTIFDSVGTTLFYDKEILSIPEEVFAVQTGSIYETREYIINYGISSNTGWRICMAMSKEQIFRNQRDMVQILVITLTLIILITILVSNKCFTIITVNFRRLIEGMEQVKQGNLLTQVEIDTDDEISFLIIEFNEMMKNVDELVHMVESKQILLKEAEIKALQQQINPHFMHNIMETIMGLASEGMNEEVITVSKCMSAMLRYNTRLENITTLREELTQIKNYVRVLKIRFEDRFEVFYDIDEVCLDCLMVKFTLQPLVENAISHGLDDTYEGGLLRIRVKEEGEKISIMIFDNGTGISAERLEHLQERLKATSERPLEYIDQYKSLGMLNVHLRLKLYYGDNYSIEIFSKPTKGTCIVIKIPCRRK